MSIKLGDICNLMTGGTPSRSHHEYFDRGEIKWLVSGDIHKGEINDCEGRITEAGLKNSNARILPINSVMIALNGQGKTRASVAMLRTEATCNQSLVSIYPKDDSKVLPEWIYWNLKGRYGELRRLTGDSGNDRRGLNMIIIRNLDLPEPPTYATQLQMVAKLDSTFGRIDQAQRLTHQSLRGARMIFDSELSSLLNIDKYHSIPRTLKEVSLDYGRGKSKHRPRNDRTLYDGKYPFVQTGEIRESEHYVSAYTKTYNDAGLFQSKLWPKGTVCITIAANIAETGILDFDACFPDSVIGVVVDPTLASNDYVEFLLQAFKVKLQALGKGSAQDNINLGTFEKLKFPFPSINEQKNIVARFNNLTTIVVNLEKRYKDKLSLLESLKESISNKVFSESAVE